jgi:NTP pyrophosphatase (non-canonical NTP hydrolase)
MKLDTEKLGVLVDEILKFNDHRGWSPVAEDLAKSVVLESSELMEHFQWDASSVTRDSKLPEKDLEEIGFEVADVFWYLVLFCEEMDIDLVEALEEKLKHNDKKFPAEQFGGEHDEKFYREQKKAYREKKGVK